MHFQQAVEAQEVPRKAVKHAKINKERENVQMPPLPLKHWFRYFVVLVLFLLKNRFDQLYVLPIVNDHELIPDLLLTMFLIDMVDMVRMLRYYISLDL